MDKWWYVSWKRVGITLLVIFLTPLLLAGVGLLVHYQLGPWRFAHSIATTNPGIDKAPAALPDNSVATLSGERIERFGFSIQLPWNNIHREQTNEDGAFVSSNNGGVVIIRNPLSSFDRNALMRLWAKTIPALQKESLRTNYALTAAAMNASPEQVKWWKPPFMNAKDLSLLLMKSFVKTDCGGVIYAIQSGEIRGFQIGNPSVAPYCVDLDLFDGADRHYEFRIDEYPKRGPVITQAEINAMVASLHPGSRN